MGNGIILTRNLTEQKVRCKRRKFYDGYECLGTWASSWLIREPNLQCHIKGVIISHSHVDHFFQGSGM
ncbi:hypothetical protein CE91St54_48610 [Hungatella hathewayi]|uniref:Uncharacterized protein n=1 Tax=Hungatella hathewayi TaxID=154046 RepID=A0AA37N8K0_9FIRM|nr:hypothetical protein CE91St55_41970 [Hungatella hathewayi]GKH09753.1 hypothetical protein CE91St54_48610 [Hungatella hathewayi]